MYCTMYCASPVTSPQRRSACCLVVCVMMQRASKCAQKFRDYINPRRHNFHEVFCVSERSTTLATCAKSLWCLLFCTHFAARTKFINARTVHCARCSAVWSPNKHFLQAEDHLLLWDFRNTLAMQCQLDYELFSCISFFHILLLRKLKLHSFWRLYKMRVRPILDFIQLFMEWFPSSKLTSNLCTSLNLGVYIYTWMIEWMNWF